MVFPNVELKVGVSGTANFGIDSIPSNYRASITDTDTYKNPDHWMILYFCLQLADHDYDNNKTQDKDFSQINN